jgi:hypothetical protein
MVAKMQQWIRNEKALSNKAFYDSSQAYDEPGWSVPRVEDSICSLKGKVGI